MARPPSSKEEGKQEAARLEGKLANAEFASKAPPEVVAEHEERLRTIQQEQALLTSSEQQVQAMKRD